MGRERSASDLLFLVSLGMAGAGCPGDDGSTGDDGGGASTTAVSTGASTGVSSSGEATIGEATSRGDATASTGSSGSGSTGVDGTSGTTGEAECDELPPLRGEVGEGCIGYVELREMCVGGRPLSPECLAYEQALCQYQIEYNAAAYGGACGMAFEELFVCLSQLSCEAFTGDDPCPAETEARMSACM